MKRHPQPHPVFPLVFPNWDAGLTRYFTWDPPHQVPFFSSFPSSPFSLQVASLNESNKPISHARSSLTNPLTIIPQTIVNPSLFVTGKWIFQTQRTRLLSNKLLPETELQERSPSFRPRNTISRTVKIILYNGIHRSARRSWLLRWAITFRCRPI